MTNEWEEFLTYTTRPTYTASGKRDTTYLGRFTLDMIAEFTGIGRILTIIARGYLYHDEGGQLLPGSPYDRIDHARNALCAWCSVPEKQKSSGTSTDFGYLSADFPELVNDKGEGWFYRHVKNVLKFVKRNPDSVSKTAVFKCKGISKGFTQHWKNKVKQLQVPIFAVNTKGAWALRFDNIIADALEAGALRMEEYPLPQSVIDRLNTTDLNGVPANVVTEVIRYCLANRQADTDWVVLPVTNFDAYFGNNNFSKKWLKAIPETVLVRDRGHCGVCRVKVVNEMDFYREI